MKWINRKYSTGNHKNFNLIYIILVVSILTRVFQIEANHVTIQALQKTFLMTKLTKSLISNFGKLEF